MLSETVLAFLAFLAFAWMGCGPPLDPAIEVGTGSLSFERLDDGQDVPMIEGAQGGWHLWISVRTVGMDPDRVSVIVETFPLETGRPRQTTRFELSLSEAGEPPWDEALGVVAVMSLPECFQDREIVVRVSATDRFGRQASDERVVIPRWDEDIGECQR